MVWNMKSIKSLRKYLKGMVHTKAKIRTFKDYKTLNSWIIEFNKKNKRENVGILSKEEDKFSRLRD